jgi:thiamine-phosphate pyrophosphorylase
MVIPGGLVVLTDRRSAAGPLVSVVRAAVRGGAAWVSLRERDLPYGVRRTLADDLRAVVPPGRLIVAGPDPLGGTAVHLAEADPFPLPRPALVGRSTHAPPPGVSRIDPRTSGSACCVGSAAGGEGVDPHTLEKGPDYVTVSPVFPSASKPGYGPALGAERAAAVAGDVPWLALGGVDSAERAAECAAAGAAGIAVMGAVMRADHPEAMARILAGGFASAGVRAGLPAGVRSDVRAGARSDVRSGARSGVR